MLGEKVSGQIATQHGKKTDTNRHDKHGNHPASAGNRVIIPIAHRGDCHKGPPEGVLTGEDIGPRRVTLEQQNHIARQADHQDGNQSNDQQCAAGAISTELALHVSEPPAADGAHRPRRTGQAGKAEHQAGRNAAYEFQPAPLDKVGSPVRGIIEAAEEICQERKAILESHQVLNPRLIQSIRRRESPEILSARQLEDAKKAIGAKVKSKNVSGVNRDRFREILLLGGAFVVAFILIRYLDSAVSSFILPAESDQPSAVITSTSQAASDDVSPDPSPTLTPPPSSNEAFPPQ